jgi:hypothetical protein
MHCAPIGATVGSGVSRAAANPRDWRLGIAAAGFIGGPDDGRDCRHTT